jgi:hypothetical protein
MGSIAKGLVLGKAATAKRDDLPPGKPEDIPFVVMNLEIPFDANGTVS